MENLHFAESVGLRGREAVGLMNMVIKLSNFEDVDKRLE